MVLLFIYRWNIAQGGLWDVDGTGIKKIEDQGLAQAILDRTNKMNTRIGVQAVGLTVVLAVLPEIYERLKLFQ